ncbi:malectin domain-containing carbohydrate-binding protein [Halorientalis pallida]|uniref:malectin domain-containing carbohydrate-binding protein n=1 Tax=Halorientalis pallida TaxID=2479928 RepID=UPI003C6FBE92
MSSRQRAQSEVIGVTLLIGVVVILVGIATVFVLGGGGGGDEPLADLQFEATAENVSITHVGGDAVPVGELRLLVRGGGSNGRFTVDAANLSGGDDEFGLGDSITRAHGVTSETFEVLLVHEPTNAILGRDALNVPDPGEPSASFTYVPGTPQPGETVTFDAGGSRAPNGTITSYEWDFDDGTVTSTGSSTIDHSFASEGEYNVTLTVTTDAGKTAVTNRTVSVTTPVVFAVNSGGPSYTAGDGTQYQADTQFTGGSTFTSGDPISGTTDDTLYQSERYGDFSYDVPVSDGEYRVTFKLAEIYWTSDGQRQFDVSLEGTERISNLDIHSQVGHDAALDLTRTVTVTDGTLNIEFSTDVDNAKSSAIKVERIGDAPSPASLSWDTASDWDGATSENAVVHEGYGDRTAGAVELGYPGDGSRWDGAPLAFWPFDEDSGSTVADVTGNGNDGTVQGATLGQGGILGTTAIQFDGTDDYVSGATDITALRETASISAWIRTTQGGNDTPWVAPGITGVESNGDGDDIFWGFIDGSGNIAIQTGNDATARSSSPVNDGTWHHVVLTRESSSGEIQVYVDGTLDDTATSRTGTITNTFDSIGRIEDTGGTPEYFDGRIEELRVYDSVLSSGAVSDLYAAGSSGSLTTGQKTFATARDPANLQLTNVAATLPAGTGIDVTVESDPDGDGTFEETSDAITLDGSGGPYDVTGLSSPSGTFRLVVQSTTSSPTESPSLDRADLTASP